MNRKAIAILGAIFLLIIGTLGFIIFSRSGNDKAPAEAEVAPGGETTELVPPTETTSDTETGAQEEIDTGVESGTPGQPVKLSDDLVISPVLFFDGLGVSYFTSDGILYKANLEENAGKTELVRKRSLGIQQHSNISRILWPKDGDYFIAELQTASGQKAWSLFDHVSGAYVDFPSQVAWVDWMPSGDKIVYVWLEDGKATLNISDPDTRNWQLLAELWEPDNAVVVSPDGQNIAFYRTLNDAAVNKLTLVTSDGKVWQDVSKDGYNFGVLWSPDGKKLLFGKKERTTLKYQLWYYDLYSGEIKNLGLFTTPDKAVWSETGDKIYAAVPTTGNAGSGQLTQDSFFEIDPVSLQKREYTSGSLIIDGRDLFLDKEGRRLLFKNAQDGGLYYLDLAQ